MARKENGLRSRQVLERYEETRIAYNICVRNSGAVRSIGFFRKSGVRQDRADGIPLSNRET
ncbi:hypothetical protein [Duncaniella muris]|uniref:hypothetical protein n=1 Tax=Duncaniella muris TaxID=2094150 RepID=UPI003F662795